MSKRHNKITIGWVTQTYDGSACVEQEFTAGDEVYYEDPDDGERVEVDTNKEEYCPFHMVQPKDM